MPSPDHSQSNSSGPRRARVERFRQVSAVICAAFLAVLIAACGGDSGSSDTGSGDVGQEAVDSLIKGEGYEDPDPGPAAAPDKKVWVLSCNQATTNCSVFADEAMSAGEELGWDMHLYDIKFDPTRAVQGVRQAIADGADGIATYLTDCEFYKQALVEARDAGLKSTTAESIDCDPPLYDSVVSYTQGPYLEWLKDWGAAQAKLAIGATNGEAKIIRVSVPVDVLSTPEYIEGFDRGLSSCDTCEVVEDIEIGFADLGAPLQQKVQEALVQHPDANAIAFPADAMLSAGIEAGLRGAGRYDDIFIGLGEGDPAVMDKIRNGTLEGAGVGVATDWEAYAAMNNLNRLFQGEEPVSSGIGLQAFDQDNNIPPSGIYKPPLDFKPTYLSAWGA